MPTTGATTTGTPVAEDVVAAGTSPDAQIELIAGSIGGGVLLAVICVAAVIMLRGRSSNAEVSGPRKEPHRYPETWSHSSSEIESSSSSEIESSWSSSATSPPSKIVKQASSREAASGDRAVAKLRKQWNVAYDQIEKGKEIARGNFGVVFMALYRSNECVLKEIIVPDDASAFGPELAQARLEMLDEALLMATLKPHGSIATFYGVCLDPDSPLCVLTEFVAGGNLHDFLQQCDHVTARDGLSLGRDLASGLQHLTETNILHSDIAARNCLLVPNTRPLRLKICDYGLSTRVSDGQKWIDGGTNPFPVRWAAPEIFTEPQFAYHFPGSDVSFQATEEATLLPAFRMYSSSPYF
jgi:Protein tyrosine and serine/threonine kinase